MDGVWGAAAGRPGSALPSLSLTGDLPPMSPALEAIFLLLNPEMFWLTPFTPVLSTRGCPCFSLGEHIVNLRFGERHGNERIFRGLGLARVDESCENLGLPLPVVAVSAQALGVSHGSQGRPGAFLTRTWPSELILIGGCHTVPGDEQ